MSEPKRRWKYIGPNYVLDCGDSVVSYNPGSYGPAMFDGDGGSDETALVKDGEYYILNGDFRDQYQSIADQGFKECITVFLSNQKCKSSWSSDYDISEVSESTRERPTIVAGTLRVKKG